MNQPDNQSSPLDQLTRDLANLSVPEGPDAEVKQRLLEMLTPTSDEPATVRPLPFWRGKTMRKIAIVAALVLVVLGSLDFLSPSNKGGSGEVFAAMLEQVRQIRTVTYEAHIGMKGIPALVTQTSVLEPNWLRQVSTVEGKEFQQVVDVAQGKSISLFPSEKKAIVLELMGRSEQQRQSIIKQFGDLSGESAIFVGEEDLDGVSVLKYTCNESGMKITVWTDPLTRLPIKVFLTDSNEPSKAKMQITYTNFVWDVELDESLFTLEVPDGYTTQNQAMNVSEAREEDFLDLYRIYARLNNDTFPDEVLDVAALVTMGTLLDKPEGTPEEKKEYRIEKLSYALGENDLEDLNPEDRSMRFMQPMMRGLSFYQEIKKNQHWHYQGKGIQLGEADKIVAWWYPKGDEADTAHVLYGDLRIEAMPVDQLPMQEK